MIERETLEYCRYLGGDPMLSILICDDDTSMITAIRATTEKILKESELKAKIHTFTDAKAPVYCNVKGARHPQRGSVFRHFGRTNVFYRANCLIR